MDIISAQVVTILTLFLSMFISCLLPVKFVFKNGSCELGISLANCLSSGVFVATFFIGLLPEVREQFRDILYHHEIITGYPVTEFVVFWGFFLAFFTEQFIISCRECVESRNRITDTGTSENCRDDVLLTHSNHNHNHSHHDIQSAINPKSGVRIGILLSSLGVHSLFEGMTLGLQTHLHDLVNLFIGVLIHECLIAFGVGISLANAKIKFRTSVLLAILISITIPIGQVIGMVIGNVHQSGTNYVMVAVLQAVAAGTFIHVTFLDIIPEGLGDEKCRMLKIFCIFLGFIVIAVIPVFFEIHMENSQLIRENYADLLMLKYNVTQL